MNVQKAMPGVDFIKNSTATSIMTIVTLAPLKLQQMFTQFIKTTIMLCSLLLIYSTGQSQYLKITHLGLGHGDCTFIIAQEKNGEPVYTVMIDFLGTGKEAFDAVRYEFENDTVLTKSGHRTIDYIVITHPHTDHFQGTNAFINALNAYNKKAVNKNRQIAVDSYITREQINLGIRTSLQKKGQLDCNGVITASDDAKRKRELMDEGYSEDDAEMEVEDENAFKMKAMEREGETMIIHQATKTTDPEIEENWKDGVVMWGKTLQKLSKYKAKAIPLGYNLFEKFTEQKVGMICIVGSGQVAGTPEPFLTKTTSKFGNRYSTKNPNDLSVGFIINCEAFTYLTMGDLAGVNGSAYRDGETGVATALTNWLPAERENANFHLCALKLGHHGSEHSTKASFCSTLRPVFGFVQAAGKPFSGTRLPHQVAITNFKNGPKATSLLYTFQPEGYTQSTTSYDGFDTKFSSNDVATLQDIQLIVSHPSDDVNYPEEIALKIGYRERDEKKRKLTNGYNFIPFVKTNDGKYLTECSHGHAWSRFYKEKR